MTNKAIDLARLIAQRRHDRESPEYVLAVELLRLLDALETAGELSDGEFRHCCNSHVGEPHRRYCQVGQALGHIAAPKE